MNQRASYQGFTLIELLVGVVISMITTVVAGKVMLDQIESTKQIEGLQRQRDDWSRTNSFITSEVNLASRISTSLNFGEGSNCLIGNGSVKMVVHFARNRQLPPSIYYTTETQEGWKKNLLKRCGPSINSNGDYTNEISEDIVIDGLNAIDGFTATITGDKLATFTINLEGLLNNAYTQKEGARARVQDVYLHPIKGSICLQDKRATINGVKVNLSNRADTFNDRSPNWTEMVDGNVLICGHGGGDTITGGEGNDQLEAGNPGASEMNGGNGDDRLLGSDDNDVLEGGNGNDILIARLGNDQMTGGAGTNHYVPGLDETGGLCDRDTVIGSNGGYDIIYFSDSSDQYTLSLPCNQSSCRIRRNDSDDRKVVDVSGGNRLIFSGNEQEQIELAKGDAAVLPPLAGGSCTVDIAVWEIEEEESDRLQALRNLRDAISEDIKNIITRIHSDNNNARRTVYLNATRRYMSPRRDELQACNPYLRFSEQHVVFTFFPKYTGPSGIARCSYVGSGIAQIRFDTDTETFEPDRYNIYLERTGWQDF